MIAVLASFAAALVAARAAARRHGRTVTDRLAADRAEQADLTAWIALLRKDRP